MPRRKQTGEVLRKSPPVHSPEAREQQMIALAVDLAERQLREGTASSQVITHYLKLGATTARLEQEKLKSDIKLNGSKIERMESLKNIETLYADAIKAMGRYRIPHHGEEYDE